MPSTSEPIVQQLRQEFETVLAYLTGPEAATQTAYTVELTLFRQLLALGATLLRLFFVSRAAERPAAPIGPDGGTFTYHDCRPLTYYSIFGKVRFARHYFTTPGYAGVCPLDAALSLPERCYSDLLREWAAFGATDESYRESQTGLERILGRHLSLQAIETNVREDAADVTAFYAQPPDPDAPVPLGAILVVQADGKGVPQAHVLAGVPRERLGKGQKRSKKKEAVVTCLYSIAPYHRTPADVVAALLQDPRPAELATRPRPVAKEVHATLEGKTVALTRLRQRVAQRGGVPDQQRVALTDGAEALQAQLLAHFPAHTLVLDIIHATEYLWDAANTLLGESHPERKAWVRTRLQQVVGGATATVIAELEAAAQDAALTETQRKVVLKTVGYYRRNLPYMHYDMYLARGWPIGTGVVEGACGHLVKDRMEQAGMRWTQAGAQAVLDLRAVRLNDDWDAYWAYHRQQQHQRVYGAAAPVPQAVEAQVLQLAA